MSRVHEDYILIDTAWADKAGLKGTKSGKARVVPITERMRSLIMETASGRMGDGFVFSVNGTSPCEDRAITYAMGSAMKKAGIDARGEGLTFHSLRHFFNTQMVSAGIPGEIVRKTVGLESREMTCRCFHVDEAALGQVRDVQLSRLRHQPRGGMGERKAYRLNPLSFSRQDTMKEKLPVSREQYRWGRIPILMLHPTS